MLTSGGVKLADANLALIVLVQALPTALADEFEGKVVRVLHGDTADVLHGTYPERIRLNGIDCPQKEQALGPRAKQLTATLCFGKVVKVVEKGQDRYGRTIGEVFGDGLDVNQERVREGFAWWDRRRSPDGAYLRRLEQEARGAKRELWSDPAPAEPWDWRRRGRGGRSNDFGGQCPSVSNLLTFVTRETDLKSVSLHLREYDGCIRGGAGQGVRGSGGSKGRRESFFVGQTWQPASIFAYHTMLHVFYWSPCSCSAPICYAWSLLRNPGNPTQTVGQLRATIE